MLPPNPLNRCYSTHPETPHENSFLQRCFYQHSSMQVIISDYPRYPLPPRAHARVHALGARTNLALRCSHSERKGIASACVPAPLQAHTTMMQLLALPTQHCISAQRRIIAAMRRAKTRRHARKQAGACSVALQQQPPPILNARDGTHIDGNDATIKGIPDARLISAQRLVIPATTAAKSAAPRSCARVRHLSARIDPPLVIQSDREFAQA